MDLLRIIDTAVIDGKIAAVEAELRESGEMILAIKADQDRYARDLDKLNQQKEAMLCPAKAMAMAMRELA